MATLEFSNGARLAYGETGAGSPQRGASSMITTDELVQALKLLEDKSRHLDHIRVGLTPRPLLLVYPNQRTSQDPLQKSFCVTEYKFSGP